MNLDLNAMNLFGDNISLKQVFLDTIRPVGSVYVQYPQQDSPQDLFNGDGVASTWQEINYDGAFFRASGGNAASYIDKTKVLVKQSDQNKSHTHGMQNHTHNMNHIHDRGNMEITGNFGNYTLTDYGNSMVGDGAFQQTASYGTHYYIDEGRSVDNKGINFTASRNWSGYTGGVLNPDWGNPYPISNTGGPSNNTTTNGTNCGDEARPSNYTIKVWKRTA